jgi:hypothetical protein
LPTLREQNDNVFPQNDKNILKYFVEKLNHQELIKSGAIKAMKRPPKTIISVASKMGLFFILKGL